MYDDHNSLDTKPRPNVIGWVTLVTVVLYFGVLVAALQYGG